MVDIHLKKKKFKSPTVRDLKRYPTVVFALFKIVKYFYC